MLSAIISGIMSDKDLVTSQKVTIKLMLTKCFSIRVYSNEALSISNYDISSANVSFL